MHCLQDELYFNQITLDGLELHVQHSKSRLISVANQSQCEFLKRIITMLYLLDIPLIGSSNLLLRGAAVTHTV